MEIHLEDLRPEDAEITIDGEPMLMRKLNAQDEGWLRANIGTDPAALSKLSDEQLYRICFHQLKTEDQQKFKSTKVKWINEDTGEETTETLGGWRLFSTKVFGLNDKMMLHKALAHIVGISRPLWDKILSDEEKKLMNEAPKDQKKKKSIGRK